MLVDALSKGLQDAETPEQWAIQRLLVIRNVVAAARASRSTLRQEVGPP